MKLKNLIWMIMLIVLSSYTYSLEGGSSNSYSTDPTKYFILTSFNGTNGVTGSALPNITTGQNTTTGAQWNIGADNNMHHPKIGSANQVCIRAGVGDTSYNATQNFTISYDFNLSANTHFGLEFRAYASTNCGVSEAASTTNVVFGFGTLSNGVLGQIQYQDGENSNGASKLNVTATAEVNYSVRIVVDVTNFLVNYTIYNMTNSSGTLVYGDGTSTGHTKHSWNGTTHIQSYKLMHDFNDASSGATTLTELAIWNWTSASNAMVRPLVSSGDTTKPFVASQSINITNPKVKDFMQFGVNCTDETAIGSIYFAHNLSGIFVNISNITGLNQQSVNYTINLTNNNTRGKVIGGIFTCNDTSSNMFQSNITTYTVANTLPNSTSIVNATGIFRLNFTPTWTASNDSDNDVIYYLVYYNLTPTGVVRLGNTTNLNITLNLTADGNYSLIINVTDLTGIVSSSFFNFGMDFTAPVFTSANNKTTTDNSTAITTITNVNLSIFGLADIYLDRGNFSENVTGTWINHSFTSTGNGTYYYILSSANFTTGEVVGWKFYAYDTVRYLLDPIYTFLVLNSNLPTSSSSLGGGGGSGTIAIPQELLSSQNPYGSNPEAGKCADKEQLFDSKCYPCDPNIGYLEFNPNDRSVLCKTCNQGFIPYNGTCILLPSQVNPSKLNIYIDATAKYISRIFNTDNLIIGYSVIFTLLIISVYYGYIWLIQ